MNVLARSSDRRVDPLPDSAWIACELCGLIELLIEPEPFERVDFATLVESEGWSAEYGPVACPDCVVEALTAKS